MIHEIAEWALLIYIAYAVWKFLKMIGQVSDWLIRNPQLDQVVEIPLSRHFDIDEMEDDGVVVHGEFDIDLDDDESTAVLKFIDQFREAKRNHGSEGY